MTAKPLPRLKSLSSVTSIDSYAFWDCTSLTSVTFANASKLTSLKDDAFFGCTSLSTVYASENSPLAAALSKIGTFYFHDSANPCDNSTHANKPHYCKR